MSDYAQGREQLVLVKPETAYGTQVKPVAADGVRVLSLGLTYDRERRTRADKQKTRSALSRYFGRYSADWTMRKYLMASGAAGTAPDDGEILKALLGKETVNTGVSVVYEPDSTADPISLDLYHITGHLMEGVVGAAVNQAVFRWSGTEEITVEYSGPAQKGLFAGTDAASGSGSAVDQLVVDDPYKFALGGIIKIASDDNTGAGYRITAINYSTSTLTLEAVATWDAAAVVAPFLPTPTVAGDPLMGTLVTLKIDTVELATTEAVITVNEQRELVADEAGTDAASAIVTPNLREITFELGAYCKKDYFGYQAKALEGAGGDIEIVMGDTAGKMVQIDMDQADYDVSSIEIPDSDEVKLSVRGRAVGSSGDDEIDITFK